MLHPAQRRSSSPLRPLLLLLPLMLTLAAHATVRAELGKQTTMHGTTPDSIHLKGHDAQSSDGDHPGPSAEHEASAGNHQRDEGVEPDMYCKGRTGEDAVRCEQERQQAESAGDHAAWLHAEQSARGRRRKPATHTAATPKGEDRTRSSLNQSDFKRSGDGKKCCSWSKNRNLSYFMRIILAYVTNGWRRIYCYPRVNRIAWSSDFYNFHRKASKSNITGILPTFVKEIKCRYDLVEGAVNNLAKFQYGCNNLCNTHGGRDYCRCVGAERVEDDDFLGVVRHCKPLDPARNECPPGYELDCHSMVCVDVDECEKENGGCQHVCLNTNGGYKCICSPHFFLMEDGKSCDYLDECAIREGGRSLARCAHKCINLPHGYRCSCPEGFELDSRDDSSCINEKDNITMTLEGVFYPKPTVRARAGKCPKGFRLEADNATCTDIDECRENMSDCKHICHNLYGGYKCKCREGFHLLEDGRSCQDFDECCHKFISKCQHECVNTEGSYRCECPSGYRLKEDGQSCEEIDECREKTAGCSGACENTDGSFKCLCERGFYLKEDYKTCQDIDECRLGLHGCEQGCENSVGSFKCTCHPGYTLAKDGKSCRDVDECRRKLSNCSHLCENTVGSYRCGCPAGFFLMEDGKSCDDRDECEYDKHGRRVATCSHECINLANGFMCVCPAGYRINRLNLCEPEESYASIGGGQSCDLP